MSCPKDEYSSVGEGMLEMIIGCSPNVPGIASLGDKSGRWEPWRGFEQFELWKYEHRDGSISIGDGEPGTNVG